MGPRQATIILLLGALLLPIAVCVSIGAAALLAAMQDTAGAAVLNRIALAAGVLWSLNLILLLVWLAVKSIGSLDTPQRPSDSAISSDDADSASSRHDEKLPPRS